MFMRIKHILLVLMSLILILPSLWVNVAAKESATANKGDYAFKDEVVYATLSATGEQQDIYVVNYFDVVKGGVIVDHGTYSSLKNLTDLSNIEQQNNTVTFTAPEGKFYYQGNLHDAPLPWNISISYVLDGKEIAPGELAGKDGHVQIKIHTSANDQVDSTFFENYVLQISLNLDPEIFSNIEAADGMIANAGKNKQVTFTVMPEKEGELSLEADAVDFELQGIEIAAVPQSMTIDAPDVSEMTGEMTSLTDAIKAINHGVRELNEGVSDLNDGVVSLRDGSAQYKQGMSDIDAAAAELVNASVAIEKGLTQMRRSLGDNSGAGNLSELNQLPEGLAQIAAGMHASADGLATLNENYSLAYRSLDQAMAAIPEYNLTEEQIRSLYRSGADPAVLDQLVETYSAARTAKGTYVAVKEAYAAVEPTLTEVSRSVREMANTLDAMATDLTLSIEEMNITEAVGKLQEGLATLATNYGAFHTGLVDYTDGVGQLAASYNELHAGIVDLSQGTTELEAGVSELHHGTSKLEDSTGDLPEQMQDEVDQMIDDFDKSDFEPVSFASAHNEKINTVQFVIKTESIEKEEQEAAEEKVEAEKGFWDRLLDLFR